MKLKFLSLAILCCLLFNCKEETKTTFTPEEEAVVPAKKVTIQDIDADLQPDKVVYSGVWTTKNANSQTEVILNQNNLDVKGTLAYKEFDTTGKLNIVGNAYTVIGKVENEGLKVDIYDVNNSKISSATLSQNNKELTFKLTGKKINNIDNFTATKRSL